MNKTVVLKNLDETHAWAREFAKTLHAPCVVALHGDLGMGKTEIARTIIQTLCGSNSVVPSPTFTLVQSYEGACHPRRGGLSDEVGLGGASSDKINNSKMKKPPLVGCADTPPLRGGDAPLQISHFDLFRITDASELEEIGLNHAMANDITLIEWPELAEPMLPADTIHIYLTAEGEGRNLEVVSNK